MWRILYLGLDPTNYLANGTITHWPIIKIAPCVVSKIIVDCLQAFESYSHVIVTSKSTVHILRDYLQKYQIDLAVWQKKITIAIGAVTAQHLKMYAIDSLIAAEATAEGVIQTLDTLSARGSLCGAHIFWPHSLKARPIIKDYLRKRQICHSICPLYEPIANTQSTCPNLHEFDEIVFTSPSTIDAFLKIFGSLPKDVILTPIGPITAQYLSNTNNRLDDR